jgi:hypothetical protein
MCGGGRRNFVRPPLFAARPLLLQTEALVRLRATTPFVTGSKTSQVQDQSKRQVKKHEKTHGIALQ